MNRRHRDYRNKTPLQIEARREEDKAKLTVKILAEGVAKSLKQFYGSAEDIEDIYIFIIDYFSPAIDAWKIAEKSVIETNKKAPKVNQNKNLRQKKGKGVTK